MDKSEVCVCRRNGQCVCPLPHGPPQMCFALASALAGLCPFKVPGPLLPGLVHWMRSCTVTCAVRSEGGQSGCTGLLRWAQLSGCAGWVSLCCAWSV